MSDSLEAKLSHPSALRSNTTSLGGGRCGMPPMTDAATVALAGRFKSPLNESQSRPPLWRRMHLDIPIRIGRKSIGRIRSSSKPIPTEGRVRFPKTPHILLVCPACRKESVCAFSLNGRSHFRDVGAEL